MRVYNREREGGYTDIRYRELLMFLGTALQLKSLHRLNGRDLQRPRAKKYIDFGTQLTVAESLSG